MLPDVNLETSLENFVDYGVKRCYRPQIINTNLRNHLNFLVFEDEYKYIFEDTAFNFFSL